MTPELYLSLLTLHGTIACVFFVLTLAPLSTFGSLVLPEQLGAKAMAFPRLNALSFWITAVSFALLLASCGVWLEGDRFQAGLHYPPL